MAEQKSFKNHIQIGPDDATAFRNIVLVSDANFNLTQILM
jgi:hypothetical protein